jgi:uncharacterized protein with PQ loop repeat
MSDIYYLSQVFGYITACINTILYIPEVIHIYTIKDTHSLNSYFLILQITSCITTLCYGALIGETPIIVSSICILVSCGFLGWAKWKLYPSKDVGDDDASFTSDNFKPLEETTPLKNTNKESSPITRYQNAISKKSSSSI